MEAGRNPAQLESTGHISGYGWDTCYKDTLLAPGGWPGVRHDFNSTRVSLRLILRN